MSVNLDDMLAISSGSMSTPFTIEVYQKHLVSDEFKKQQIKLLSANYREQRTLQQAQWEILKSFIDPEKRDKLFTAVCTVYKNILEDENANLEVDKVIEHSFEQEDDLKFLLDNKHKKFYRSGDVFDLHAEHPKQKQLVKGKYIGKRAIKKTKTPLQQFNTLVEAKTKQSKDQRLDALEKSMQETRQMMTLLASNQVELAQQLNATQKDLATLQDTVKDLRKLRLYVLIRSSNKRQTNNSLAKSLNVSDSTIKRWKRELKQEGYL